MDNAIKDFFSDLKDRITNPFVSSFAISWIVINYKIVIALVFYKVGNYSEFISIVNNNSDWWVSFWKPICCALIYTFIFQAFKSVIKGFNSWLLLFTNKIIFKWTGDLPISVKEHKEEVDKLNKIELEYANLIRTQGTFKTENETLKLAIEDLKSKNLLDIKEIKDDRDKQIMELTLENRNRVKNIQDEFIEQINNANKESGDNILALNEEINTLKREYQEVQTQNEHYFSRIAGMRSEHETALQDSKDQYELMNNAYNEVNRQLIVLHRVFKAKVINYTNKFSNFYIDAYEMFHSDLKLSQNNYEALNSLHQDLSQDLDQLEKYTISEFVDNITN